LVFLTETECVYCAVGTEYLFVIYVSLTQYCLTLRNAGSFPGNLRETFVVQSDNVTGFHRAIRYYPANTFTPMRHTYLHLHVSVTRKINEPNLGTCYKSSVLSDVGEIWIGQYLCLSLRRINIVLYFNASVKLVSVLTNINKHTEREDTQELKLISQVNLKFIYTKKLSCLWPLVRGMKCLNIDTVVAGIRLIV
jgi:hypothetical protein